MIPVPDLASAIYLGCFLFGLFFAGVTFAFGASDGSDSIGDGDVGDGSDLGHDGPSIVSLQTIVTFLAFFGGAGYGLTIALKLGGPVVLGAALIAGLAGSATLFLLLSRVIYAGQTPWMRRRDYELTGTIARVSSRISEQGTGEIVFEKQGKRRVEAAKSATGQLLPSGAEVVILRYDRGFAFVELADTFFDLPPPRSATLPEQSDH